MSKDREAKLRREDVTALDNAAREEGKRPDLSDMGLHGVDLIGVDPLNIVVDSSILDIIERPAQPFVPFVERLKAISE